MIAFTTTSGLFANSALLAQADGVYSFGKLTWIVLIAYLAGLLLMGAYFSRREKTTDDYFLGGRRVPWWAAGISIFGTGLSAITFMSITAKVAATNWIYFLGIIAPIFFIPVVVRYYIPFYRRLRITTAYEYLELRFNLPARLFASLLYIVFQFGRMAIVLYLPALALSAVTEIDVYQSILIMGLLATGYTVLGGIEAVIWTDVLQVVVLVGGAIVGLVIVAGNVEGGFGGIIEVGMANNKFHMFDWSWDYRTTAVWVVLAGTFLSAVMPNTADQSIVQRYLATPSEAAAKRAAWTSALMGIPMSLILYFLGTSFFVFYQANPELMPANLPKDSLLPLFVMQKMPIGLSGLVIAAIFAAAMSSIDSGLSGVSTAVTTDFYRRFFPRHDERRFLLAARLFTLAAGLVATAVAMIMASGGIKSAVDVFMGILGLFGGSLGGMFVLGIFTRRTTGWGVLAGAILGFTATLLVKRMTDVHFFLYAGLGLAVCISTGYLLSIFDPTGRKSTTGLTIFSMPKKTER